MAFDGAWLPELGAMGFNLFSGKGPARGSTSRPISRLVPAEYLMSPRQRAAIRIAHGPLGMVAFVFTPISDAQICARSGVDTPQVAP